MTIRPIDYINSVTRTQEIARVKQFENGKIETQTEQLAVQNEKRIERNFQKVRNATKSEGLIIDADKKKQSRDNKESSKNKKNKKEHKKAELGENIDIKI